MSSFQAEYMSQFCSQEIIKKMRLKNKIAIVTGASKGIGAAIAKNSRLKEHKLS
jgi:hypothetical protein